MSGGGRQKRIYTITNVAQKPMNGFFDLVNKYSPEKLAPRYRHYTYGNYTIEHAIIDGIKLGDARSKEATQHLFRHVRNWKRLFDLAKKHDLVSDVYELYNKARQHLRTRKMPRRYHK